MTYQFLHLMQIHDSAFPIGSYTQSFGMETYIQSDLVKDKKTLKEFCLSYLHGNLLTGDGLLVKEAYEKTLHKEWEQVEVLEKLCHGMKLAKESRDGSLMMGKQFFKAVSLLHPNGELAQLETLWKDKERKGHYPIVYGAYAATMGFSKEEALGAFLYSSVSGLIHNAVRSVPLGQSTGVELIHELLPIFTEAAREIQSFTLEKLGNQAIGLELASMEHETLRTRLFIS
ncbi:urease accessory protein UreF [Thalassorhabdus alkalitolerans]|uniref:Urease accessory protein UreF n=2 Tax=Bacillaceae TaxID=186817 RepID=A0ABW0YQA9_9BACI